MADTSLFLEVEKATQVRDSFSNGRAVMVATCKPVSRWLGRKAGQPFDHCNLLGSVGIVHFGRRQ